MYLYPVLNHDYFYMRDSAAKSILLIDGQAGLDKLKERERQLDEDNYAKEPSEKALLRGEIIHIEGGARGAEKYFFSEEGNEIIRMLNAYAEKKIKWIAKLSSSDRSEAILSALDSICFAKEYNDLLCTLSEELYKEMYEVFKKVTEIKIGSSALEEIAEITTGLKKEHALKILKLLKGNKYHSEIEQIIENCCNTDDKKYAIPFIDKNYCSLKSPYTGEQLDSEWKEEVENDDLQTNGF